MNGEAAELLVPQPAKLEFSAVRNGIFRACLTATDWYSNKAYNREVTVYICVQSKCMVAKRSKPGFLTRNLLFGADLELSAGQNAKPGSKNPLAK